ncbi:radical SAM protein [Candidatus Calescamantes bacterium]|nr:radical SAM protein [Candidatus Calescamantes bacterium]
MKTLLLNPPAFNTIVANNPPLIDEERGCNPPLGLLYLAAVARENGYSVRVLDAQVEGMGYERIEEYIGKEMPDVVGITCMTLTLPDVLRSIKVVKNVVPQAKIILGGPHPHIYPEETLNLSGVDFVVLGEGEEIFPRLLERIKQGKEPDDIPGVGWKKNGDSIVNPFQGYIEDLDSLPYPARELTPYQNYYSILTHRRPVTTMITSRGCPYSCIFCDRPHLGKKFRARSPENVVGEMGKCEEMGIKEILIYDDTFNLDKKRVLEICELKREKNLKIYWDARVRVDIFDREMAKAMKEAGCERLHFGVEAGTEKILKVLKKGINLEQVKRAFRIAKEEGIGTLAYFMIGAPGEDRGDIIATIEFALSLDPDYTHITILTPFPATKLYQMGIERGIISDFWGRFARAPEKGIIIEYWEEILSEKELQELLKLAYRKFYLRPKFIWKEIKKIRDFPSLQSHIRGGVKLLTSSMK